MRIIGLQKVNTLRGKLMSNSDEGVIGGVALILITGLLLGLAYNVAGQGDDGWGVAWVGSDPLESIPSLGSLANGIPAASTGPATYGGIDDPMAIPGGAGGDLPEIPDLDRPIQMDMVAVEQFVEVQAAFIVDARDPEEFAEGHLPGAINLPYDEAASDPVLIESLEPGDRPIIVYCGGGTCELSLSLAYEMIYAGHKKVLVFMGGFTEWSEAGKPVVSGALEG